MRLRPAALIGGVLGAAAAGVAAGVAVERLAIGRTRLRPDPDARELFGRLPGIEKSVIADDGALLHAEVTGEGDVAVVFVHGYALSLHCWHYQRRDLGDVGRLVFYDQRAHGRSDRGPGDHLTVDQLGRDLAAVLDQLVPTGPVVLVGHSMGGMTVMALAHARPELFGDRVIGVALVSTSPGKLAEVGFRLPVRVSGVLTSSVLPQLDRLIGKRASLVERGRRVGSDLAFVMSRHYGFGDDPSPAQVEFVERMLAATPVDVITGFARSIVEHDKYEALDVLAKVPTIVLIGGDDKITPPALSDEIAARVADAELVCLAGAGHMVMLERASLVNLHLRTLFRRAVATLGQP
ncbi:MAG: alpha/beta fold hydrolase [Mycobacteriales bacterium]